MTITTKTKLDVTIPASVRPDILRMTLHTFKKNLLGDFDVRIIINVDPRGEIETHTQMDMVDVCREFFADVIHRTPDTSSFADAVRWCWSQVQTEFFFHLEDDWICPRKINPAELLSPFDDKRIANVALNKRTKQSTFRVLRRAGVPIKLHGEHYVHFPSPVGAPSLHRTNYMQPLGAQLDADRDPEGQFAKLTDPDSVLFLLLTLPRPSMIDTGSTWRKRMLLNKSLDNDGETYAPPKPISLARKVQLAVRWYVSKWWWRVVYCRGDGGRHRHAAHKSV